MPFFFSCFGAQASAFEPTEVFVVNRFDFRAIFRIRLMVHMLSSIFPSLGADYIANFGLD